MNQFMQGLKRLLIKCWGHGERVQQIFISVSCSCSIHTTQLLFSRGVTFRGSAVKCDGVGWATQGDGSCNGGRRFYSSSSWLGSLPWNRQIAPKQWLLLRAKGGIRPHRVSHWGPSLLIRGWKALVGSLGGEKRTKGSCEDPRPQAVKEPRHTGSEPVSSLLGAGRVGIKAKWPTQTQDHQPVLFIWEFPGDSTKVLHPRAFLGLSEF